MELFARFGKGGFSLSPRSLGRAARLGFPNNSGEPLVPPWLPEPEALTLVASELFATLLRCNPGKSRLPPGLPEPGSLDPVASERQSTVLLELATARATELTASCTTELVATVGSGWIGVGWGAGVGVGVGPVGV